MTSSLFPGASFSLDFLAPVFFLVLRRWVFTPTPSFCPPPNQTCLNICFLLLLLKRIPSSVSPFFCDLHLQFFGIGIVLLCRDLCNDSFSPSQYKCSISFSSLPGIPHASFWVLVAQNLSPLLHVPTPSLFGHCPPLIAYPFSLNKKQFKKSRHSIFSSSFC